MRLDPDGGDRDADIPALIPALAPAAALADPVEALWRTEPDAGKYAFVRFTACGDVPCAVIARTFDATGEFDSGNLGHRIVRDMHADGGGARSGGRFWQPSTDSVYRSKMALSGDTLRVTGCFGPF